MVHWWDVHCTFWCSLLYQVQQWLFLCLQVGWCFHFVGGTLRMLTVFLWFFFWVVLPCGWLSWGLLGWCQLPLLSFLLMLFLFWRSNLLLAELLVWLRNSFHFPVAPFHLQWCCKWRGWWPTLTYLLWWLFVRFWDKNPPDKNPSGINPQTKTPQTKHSFQKFYNFCF